LKLFVELLERQKSAGNLQQSPSWPGRRLRI